MASGPSFTRAGRGAGTAAAAVFIGVLSLSGAAYPAQGGRPVQQAKPCQAAAGRTPIVVTARSLFADNKKKVAVYKGGVVVKKGDVTMYAREVTIRLKAQGDKTAKTAPASADVLGGSGKIDTIEAEGGVKIIEQDKTATGERAVYYSATDSIVLTGSPRVWQGGDVVMGSKITYDIQADTFLVDDADTVLYQGKKPR